VTVPSDWDKITDPTDLETFGEDVVYVGETSGVRVVLMVLPSQGLSSAGWAMAFRDAYSEEFDSVTWEQAQLPAGLAEKLNFTVGYEDGTTSAFTEYLLVESGQLAHLRLISSAAEAADNAPTFRQVAESLILYFPDAVGACSKEYCARPWTEFGDGLYAVGDDIHPGWHSAVGGYACLWELRSGIGRGVSQVIATGTERVVEIRGSDAYFSSSGCGRWFLSGTTAPSPASTPTPSPTRTTAPGDTALPTPRAKGHDLGQEFVGRGDGVTQRIRLAEGSRELQWDYRGGSRGEVLIRIIDAASGEAVFETANPPVWRRDEDTIEFEVPASAEYRIVIEIDGTDWWGVLVLSPRALSGTSDSGGAASAFEDGVFAVGAQISPGTYGNNDSSAGCYWARLRGFGGSLGDIIANSFSYSTQIVSISSSDVGFESSGCGQWTRQ